MSRRMMRFVMPKGDTELIVGVRGGNQWHLAESNEGSIYLYLEEDDELNQETAIFRVFESGEAVDGAYVGTLTSGRTARHVYQVNAYSVYPEEVEYDAARDVRESDVLSEVRDAGGNHTGADAQGQGEDLQHYLPE